MRVTKPQHHYFWLFYGTALTILLLDQLTKYLIFITKPEWTWGFITIHYVTNTGAGFSILQGKTFLLGIISLIAAGIIIHQYKTFPQHRWFQIFLGLIMGGILGNMLDRFLRGSVIDFIDLSFWPVFNVADAAICVGIVGIIIYYFREERNSKK